jgi:hypothetical protein
LVFRGYASRSLSKPSISGRSVTALGRKRHFVSTAIEGRLSGRITAGDARVEVDRGGSLGDRRGDAERLGDEHHCREGRDVLEVRDRTRDVAREQRLRHREGDAAVAAVDLPAVAPVR